MSFKDRSEAGRQLAAALSGYREARPVVLALPRGGLPVAKPVAEALHAPLDLVLVRKIGVPMQPELAMGAIVDGPKPLVVRNEDVIRSTGVTESGFRSVMAAESKELARRRTAYLGARPRVDVAGRTVIIVDDGVATGATTRAALRAVRQRSAAHVVLAVPVAPSDTLDEMWNEADDIACLESHPAFASISAYYDVFDQLSDAEVKKILADFPP